MLGTSQFFQQSWIGPCRTRKGCKRRSCVQAAWPEREPDCRRCFASLGGWSESANLPTLPEYHVKKVLGSGRCLPKSREFGSQGYEG